ncbi:hypothetical protein [Sneathiella glossodoripedis]|uniref:hypothetical protein n=1 Tax=Sneathiella glossodoripedis TaxID=418853 RepID=UPI00131EF0A8|nr:hypothetical protein [Sneathiella glossodoripedis]
MIDRKTRFPLFLFCCVVVVFSTAFIDNKTAVFSIGLVWGAVTCRCMAYLKEEAPND